MGEGPAGSCELISMDAQALNQVMTGTVTLSNVSGHPGLVTLLPLPLKCWDDRSESYQTKCSGASASVGDSCWGLQMVALCCLTVFLLCVHTHVISLDIQFSYTGSC